jgi:hypothetical protein
MLFTPALIRAPVHAWLERLLCLALPSPRSGCGSRALGRPKRKRRLSATGPSLLAPTPTLSRHPGSAAQANPDRAAARTATPKNRSTTSRRQPTGPPCSFGHQLDPESAGQVPANMIGRLLDDGDLQKLHRTLIHEEAASSIGATGDGREPQGRRAMTRRRARPQAEILLKGKAAPDRWRRGMPSHQAPQSYD